MFFATADFILGLCDDIFIGDITNGNAADIYAQQDKWNFHGVLTPTPWTRWCSRFIRCTCSHVDDVSKIKQIMNGKIDALKKVKMFISNKN